MLYVLKNLLRQRVNFEMFQAMPSACKVQRASCSPVTFTVVGVSLGTGFMLCTCTAFCRHVSQRIVWLLMLTLFQTRGKCLSGHNGGPKEKTLPSVVVQLGSLLSLQVEFIMNKWILLSLADLGEIFLGGCSLVRLLSSLSIIVSISRPFFFSLPLCLVLPYS